MLEGGFHAVCPVPFRDTPCVKPFVGYCSVFALVLTGELGDETIIIDMQMWNPRPQNAP